VNEVSAGRLRRAAGAVRVVPSVSETAGPKPIKFYVGHARVDFPEGYFPRYPITVLRPNTGYPGIVVQTSITGLSRTGFTAYIARTDKTPTILYWLAVESNDTTSS
jgi:hypothetical protein